MCIKLPIVVIIFCLSIACSNGKNESPESVQSFLLKDVKLLDGPFKKATELNISSLLNYEPDRLLAKFRSEAGLEPKAEHYHGWEDNTIAGHSLGHYLEACVLMFQTTGNEIFLHRVQYIVDELKECQQADVQYIIPDEFSLINSKIKVDFIPHLGHRAGPVFSVRTIKR